LGNDLLNYFPWRWKAASTVLSGMTWSVFHLWQLWLRFFAVVELFVEVVRIGGQHLSCSEKARNYFFALISSRRNPSPVLDTDGSAFHCKILISRHIFFSRLLVRANIWRRRCQVQWVPIVINLLVHVAMYYVSWIWCQYDEIRMGDCHIAG
jgi:hypothetical protein